MYRSKVDWKGNLKHSTVTPKHCGIHHAKLCITQSSMDCPKRVDFFKVLENKRRRLQVVLEK